MGNDTQQLSTTQSSVLEQVIINGDLRNLSPAERVEYYRRTCESLGLNPFTRPFEYIMLNNKLTLYAKRDATDQLRAIKGISIDDVDITETAELYVVKVKGSDKSGRKDTEIGVVSKRDMQGNIANAQMKAVTKAKRRLTLSLSGLGWTDESEIETIPNAHVVTVTEEGEIVDPEPEPESAPEMVLTSDGTPYDELPTDKLSARFNAMQKKLKDNGLTDEQKAEYEKKIKEAQRILAKRRSYADSGN